MTLYELLEVEPHASQREIKRAYRRLALRYHPDRNPGDPDAEERFKEIADAYRTLSNRRKRAEYNEQHRSPESAGPPRPSAPPRERWRPPDPADPKRWGFRRGPALDPRDAHLGALLAVSLTLAATAGDEAAVVAGVLGLALFLGVALSAPLRLAFYLEPAPLRTLAAIAAPFAATVGAVIGSRIAATEMPSLWGASGIPYAFVGGALGAVLAGALGRAFRDTLGRVPGLVAGGIVGGALGAGLSGFVWYWGSIFRWMEYPARDDLSALASVGVVGALVGAATAAAIAGAREPA